jgi:hypothetical protein
VQDALACLHGIALPYFGLFRRTQEVADSLQQRSIPSMWPVEAIEFVLCFGSQPDASRVLRRFFEERQDLVNDYFERLDEYRKFSIPDQLPGEYASQLAWASLVYGLEPYRG